MESFKKEVEEDYEDAFAGIHESSSRKGNSSEN